MAKILLVDDSNELLELFARLLTNKGYEVKTANSETKFINLLDIYMPDIILLDVKLNGADGRKLCKELKYKISHKHIPIILLSGDPLLLADYKECDADDVIEKPFALGSVIQKIERALTLVKA